MSARTQDAGCRGQCNWLSRAAAASSLFFPVSFCVAACADLGMREPEEVETHDLVSLIGQQIPRINSDITLS
jgi:hypothetical protein